MRYALYVYSPLLHLTRIRLHPYSLLFINKEAHACSFALHLLYPSILYRKVVELQITYNNQYSK